MDVNSITRRRFLSSTGMALAAVSIAPDLTFAQSAPSTRKLRVGIVGGRFGLGFQFHEHPNCHVEAVSDLIPERRAELQKTYRCAKAYDSLAELIRDPKIEAVAIFTDAPLHAEHTLACLAAGKHVLCAVPVAFTLEECHQVYEAVRKSGLTYMMAETSVYKGSTIKAKQYYREGKFGKLIGAAAQYFHPGLEALFFNPDKSRTWRYGLAPMNYPTHCTSYLLSVTGEHLTSVSCLGWGDDSPILKDNPYKNPFWKETAFFQTNRGMPFNVEVLWRGAMVGTDRGEWQGEKMSLYMPYKSQPAHLVHETQKIGIEEGGFAVGEPKVEPFVAPDYWKTDLLPAPLRHNTGHGGSHSFITHEFVDAVVQQRAPEVNIERALAFTVPGIVAHQSALKGGEQLKIPNFGL
jgi:predicted dehydrogenase